MQYIKIENKQGELICVLNMDNPGCRVIFKKIYKDIKKIDVDTYRFID